MCWRSSCGAATRPFDTWRGPVSNATNHGAAAGVGYVFPMTTVQFQSCPVLCAALNGLSAGGDIDLTQRQGTTRTRERGYSLTPEGLSHPVEVIATGMADHLKMNSSKALSAARSHELVPSLKYLITECQSPETSESGSTAPPSKAPGSVLGTTLPRSRDERAQSATESSGNNLFPGVSRCQ